MLIKSIENKLQKARIYKTDAVFSSFESSEKAKAVAALLTSLDKNIKYVDKTITVPAKSINYILYFLKEIRDDNVEEKVNTEEDVTRVLKTVEEVKKIRSLLKKIEDPNDTTLSEFNQYKDKYGFFWNPLVYDLKNNLCVSTLYLKNFVQTSQVIYLIDNLVWDRVINEKLQQDAKNAVLTYLEEHESLQGIRKELIEQIVERFREKDTDILESLPKEVLKELNRNIQHILLHQEKLDGKLVYSSDINITQAIGGNSIYLIHPSRDENNTTTQKKNKKEKEKVLLSFRKEEEKNEFLKRPGIKRILNLPHELNLDSILKNGTIIKCYAIELSYSELNAILKCLQKKYYFNALTKCLEAFLEIEADDFEAREGKKILADCLELKSPQDKIQKMLGHLKEKPTVEKFITLIKLCKKINCSGIEFIKEIRKIYPIKTILNSDEQWWMPCQMIEKSDDFKAYWDILEEEGIKVNFISLLEALNQLDLDSFPALNVNVIIKKWEIHEELEKTNIEPIIEQLNTIKAQKLGDILTFLDEKLNLFQYQFPSLLKNKPLKTVEEIAINLPNPCNIWFLHGLVHSLDTITLATMAKYYNILRKLRHKDLKLITEFIEGTKSIWKTFNEGTVTEFMNIAEFLSVYDLEFVYSWIGITGNYGLLKKFKKVAVYELALLFWAMERKIKIKGIFAYLLDEIVQFNTLVPLNLSEILTIFSWKTNQDGTLNKYYPTLISLFKDKGLFTISKSLNDLACLFFNNTYQDEEHLKKVIFTLTELSDNKLLTSIITGSFDDLLQILKNFYRSSTHSPERFLRWLEHTNLLKVINGGTFNSFKEILEMLEDDCAKEILFSEESILKNLIRSFTDLRNSFLDLNFWYPF